jgi:hypothetical protein
MFSKKGELDGCLTNIYKGCGWRFVVWHAEYVLCIAQHANYNPAVTLLDSVAVSFLSTAP